MDGRFERQGYGCVDERNSLLPVPPGETRVSMGYCARCEAARCVFLPGMERLPVPHQPRRRCSRSPEGVAGHRRYVAAMRAQGLCTNGKPLARTCWNCARLCRADGMGYVCGEAALPRTKGTVKNGYRARECQSFGMRLVMEIPEREGENGTDNG